MNDRTMAFVAVVIALGITHGFISHWFFFVAIVGWAIVLVKESRMKL